MPTASTTTATSPSTSEPPSAEDAVLDAYRAFWSMYMELAAAPPPFDPAGTATRLDALTTGAERYQLFEFLQSNAANGVVLRGDLDHAPTVESLTTTTAVVRDCLDDRLGVHRVADGSRVDQDVPGRSTYVASLRLVDGVWRVETMSTEAAPCTA